MVQKPIGNRAHPRYPIPTLVDIELDNQTFRHEFSVTISRNGMHVEADDLLAAGQTAMLRFVLPNLDWIFEIRSEVAGITKFSTDERLDGKKNGYSFSFSHMDDKDTEKLSTYLKNFKLEDLDL